MALIKLNRNKTGEVPTALADGELLVDQLKGRLYYADATGRIRYFSISPPFTGPVNKLDGDDKTTLADAIISWAKLVPAIIATAQEFQSGIAQRLLTPDNVWSAASFENVPFSSSVTLDLTQYINCIIPVAGNFTLQNPANGRSGQTGTILLNVTGTPTMTLGSAWKTASAVPPTLVGAVNRMDYIVISPTVVHYHLTRDVR